MLQSHNERRRTGDDQQQTIERQIRLELQSLNHLIGQLNDRLYQLIVTYKSNHRNDLEIQYLVVRTG